MGTTERPAVWRTLVLTGVVGGAVFALLVAGAAEVYEQVVASRALAALDEPVLAWMMSVRTPTAETLVTGFTNLGTTVPMVAIGLVLSAVLYRASRRRTVWVLMLVASAGSVVFTLVGKPAFGRARPPLASAVPPNGSPSGFDQSRDGAVQSAASAGRPLASSAAPRSAGRRSRMSCRSHSMSASSSAFSTPSKT